jgi:hypothetical protein
VAWQALGYTRIRIAKRGPKAGVGWAAGWLKLYGRERNAVDRPTDRSRVQLYREELHNQN